MLGFGVFLVAFDIQQLHLLNRLLRCPPFHSFLRNRVRLAHGLQSIVRAHTDTHGEGQADRQRRMEADGHSMKSQREKTTN